MTRIPSSLIQHHINAFRTATSVEVMKSIMESADRKGFAKLIREDKRCKAAYRRVKTPKVTEENIDDVYEQSVMTKAGGPEHLSEEDFYATLSDIFGNITI